MLVTPSRAAVEGRFDQTIPVSSRVLIDVLTGSGDISVHTGDSGKLEIHARIHADEGSGDSNLEGRVRAIEANPPIMRQSGGSIRIGHFSDPNLIRDISISYDLTVPADAQLHTETSSGDLTVEGIQGPLDASSGSGNLEISHVGGDTHASSGSGDINLRDIHGLVYVRAGTGEVRASTINSSSVLQNRKVSLTLKDDPGEALTVLLADRHDVNTEIISGSGDVELDDIAGGLQVATGSGTIQVAGNPSADWRLETGSGMVRIQVPESANFALAAHTGSGNIEAHNEVAVAGERGTRELRRQIGKGGPTVILKTGSGNIEIE